MKKTDILHAIISVLAIMACLWLISCATLTPALDEAAKCAAEGKEWHRPGVCLDKPEPGPEPGAGGTPQPEPPPDPIIITDPAPDPDPPVEEQPGEWRRFDIGESIILPYQEHIEFSVKGLDTRKPKEWHLFDFAHGRGRGVEVANAHMMIYSDTELFLIQQVYKPAHKEGRHEDYWAFRPEKVYTWVIDSDLSGVRVRIYEDGVLVVDMPRAAKGPWPVQPFAHINNFRIGCGTFPSHPCPLPIQVRIEQ